MDLNTMLDRTAQGVQEASGNKQNPAIYKQFFGTAYLGAAPAVAAVSAPLQSVVSAAPAANPTLTVTRAYGSLSISAASAGTLFLDGKAIGELPAGAEATLDGIEAGEHGLELHYAGGEKETKSVTVQKGQSSAVAFDWKKFEPSPAAEAAQAPKSEIYDSIPRAGLIAEYLFNGDAKDTSGKGNSGKLRNTKQGRDRIGMEQNSRDKWYYATIGFSVRVWNHICIVVSDNRISLYVNGARDLRSPFDTIIGQKNHMPMLIGASGRTSGSSRFFSGLFDDIRMYDRALSEPEVLTLYHEGGWAGT